MCHATTDLNLLTDTLKVFRTVEKMQNPTRKSRNFWSFTKKILVIVFKISPHIFQISLWQSMLDIRSVFVSPVS